MQTVYLLSDPRGDAARYVGVTKDLKHRMAEHLSTGTRTWCKNWIKSLLAIGLRPVVSVLEIVPDHQREDAERAWILGFRQTGANLTNLTDGGEGCPGMICTPEARAKISTANRGLKRSNETRSKMSKSFRGRKFSKEARVRMGAAGKRRARSWNELARLVTLNVGRKHSPQARANMSRGQMGNKNCLGHPHSLETRFKMSLSHRGRPKSEQHRAKLSLAHKGIFPSLETRKKMSRIRKGRKLGPQSEEHRAKLRAANLGKRYPGRIRRTRDQIIADGVL